MIDQLKSTLNNIETTFNELNLYSIKDHSVEHKPFKEWFCKDIIIFNALLLRLEAVNKLLRTKVVVISLLTNSLARYNKLVSDKLTRQEYKLLKDFFYGNK